MADKLTDDQVVSICEAEIDAASGFTSGELAADRADALDRYFGEPYGDERAGRSQVITREVLETVEWIKPSLMRIFSEADNLVVFDPVGPEDEKQAEQESDRVNYSFWKENRGFYNLLTFCTDALLSKTGNLKAWWDEEGEEEREEYQNLSWPEVVKLSEDPDVEREPIEYDEGEEPNTVDITFKARRKGRLVIDVVPPEEFGVNRDARSPYAQDCNFIYHRTRRTKSSLVQEGFDKDLLDSIPTNDDVETEERLARRNLDDEQDVLRFGTHESMREFWITECYLKLDKNGDGIAELLKVMIAVGAGQVSSGARLLRYSDGKAAIEEIDAIPFFTAAPIVLTHKFYGMSIADLVMDLQHIKSTLLRQIIDNTYLANNQRSHVNENVSLDDMLTSRPGGVVRHKGTTRPADNMMPHPHQPVPQEAYELLGYLKDQIKQRTGASDDTAGLDHTSLANVNTGVFLAAYDAARMKIELIARILTEIGLRPLFLHIHKLLQQNQSKAEVLKLRGEWVEVNPGEWRDRKNVTLGVGMGVSSRERRIVALGDVLEKQGSMLKGGLGGVLVGPQHIYKATSDYYKAWGLEPDAYFQDPEKLPPKQPEGPTPEAQLAEAQGMALVASAKAQGERNQVEMFKAQSATRVKEMEIAQKAQEAEYDRQMEALRTDIARLKAERDQAHDTAKMDYSAQLDGRAQEIKIMEMRHRDAQENAKREADMLKAFISSGTQLTVEQMKQAGIQPPGEDVADAAFAAIAEMSGAASDAIAEVKTAKGPDVGRIVANLQTEIERLHNETREPVDFVRDDTGRTVRVGKRVVIRDDDGRPVRLERED